MIIPISNKKAVTLKRFYQCRVRGIFKLVGIIVTVHLKAPELVTVDHIRRHLAEQGIYMIETLRIVDKCNMVMSAGQKRIQKQRIYVAFKGPAVHLHAEFIPKYKRYRQGIIFIVDILEFIGYTHNLFQRLKFFIGKYKLYIGTWM